LKIFCKSLDFADDIVRDPIFNDRLFNDPPSNDWRSNDRRSNDWLSNDPLVGEQVRSRPVLRSGCTAPFAFGRQAAVAEKAAVHPAL
jgi:hypothetical protein